MKQTLQDNEHEKKNNLVKIQGLKPPSQNGSKPQTAYIRQIIMIINSCDFDDIAAGDFESVKLVRIPGANVSYEPLSAKVV